MYKNKSTNGATVEPASPPATATTTAAAVFSRYHHNHHDGSSEHSGSGGTNVPLSFGRYYNHYHHPHDHQEHDAHPEEQEQEYHLPYRSSTGMTNRGVQTGSSSSSSCSVAAAATAAATSFLVPGIGVNSERSIGSNSSSSNHRTHHPPPHDNSDNWVDLEELYRWLQELEDTTKKAPTTVLTGVDLYRSRSGDDSNDIYWGKCSKSSTCDGVCE